MEGFDVLEAPDGAAGLDAAAGERPDAVVLDLMMPGLSGEEVLVRLKARDPGLPVIIFSAFPERKPAIEALGADGFFLKTPNLEGLMQTLWRLTKKAATA